MIPPLTCPSLEPVMTMWRSVSSCSVLTHDSCAFGRLWRHTSDTQADNRLFHGSEQVLIKRAETKELPISRCWHFSSVTGGVRGRRRRVSA